MTTIAPYRSTDHSRRTIAKGAVWAVPTLLVGGAAPAFAASPPPYLTSVACKAPGESDVPGGYPKHGYLYTITTRSALVTITVLSVAVNGVNVVWSIRTVGPNKSLILVDANSSPSSFVMTMLVNGVRVVETVSASPHCPWDVEVYEP